MRLRPLWIWTKEEEEFYRTKCIGFTLHVCCGVSTSGDVRVDKYDGEPDIRADYRFLPFQDSSFDTVLCDPPWGKREQVHLGIINWISELRRVTKKRIIIIHNTMFVIVGCQLIEAWAVCARGGFLYKPVSIYEKLT